MFAIRASCYRFLGQYDNAGNLLAAAILASSACAGAEEDLCRRAAKLHRDRGDLAAATSLAMRGIQLAPTQLGAARACIDLAAIICWSRTELQKAAGLVSDAKRTLPTTDLYRPYADQIELFCWAETPSSQRLSNDGALNSLEELGETLAPQAGTTAAARFLWLSGVVMRRLARFETAKSCFEQALEVFRGHGIWPQMVLCVIESALTKVVVGESAAAYTEVGRLFPVLSNLQGADRHEVARILRAAARGRLSVSDLARSQNLFALR